MRGGRRFCGDRCRAATSHRFRNALRVPDKDCDSPPGEQHFRDAISRSGNRQESREDEMSGVGNRIRE